MSNPYYNHTGYPSTGESALSARFRSELALVSAAFAKLPPLTPAGAPAQVDSTGSVIGLFSPYVVSGTWTPVFTFSIPGNLSVDYLPGAGGYQLGSYSRFGKFILLRYLLGFNLTYTTAAGQALVTGLPFLPAYGPSLTDTYSAGESPNYTAITLSAGKSKFVAYILQDPSVIPAINFVQYGGANTTSVPLTVSNIASGGGEFILEGSIAYFTG